MRSGSSLLSVAEALEREGVPRSRILILCAYEPDVNTLCAPDAAQRWQPIPRSCGRYDPTPARRCGSVSRRRSVAEKFLSTDEHRPAVWPEMERLRYRSAEGHTLLTFEGHGPYGAAVSRQKSGARGGGVLAVVFRPGGGLRTAIIAAGKCGASERMCSVDAHGTLLRLAGARIRGCECRYVALETMVRVNFEREFGVAPEDMALPVELPTVCDARMMPHEWLRSADSRWWKLDAAIHGDDHFFPGPCDIAWDLAGISVEWELSNSAREFLLAAYCQASGDDASSRILSYELAYATFRMAWSRMAAGSTGDREEQARLLRDYEKYRQSLQRIPTSHVVGFSETCRP